MCLLLNTGVGTFQPTLDLGIAAQWLVSADFNGDGEADLAIATGTQVAVLLGNGDGTFKPPANVNGPGGSLAVGDLNGDGKADLVVFHNGISVLFGNGDGTFQTAVDYSTAEQTWAGSVGDFDGDGKNDIAALGSAGLTVFTNNGDGTFQASTNYGAGSGISGLAITDLDGDGKPDISVSNVAPPILPSFSSGRNGQHSVERSICAGWTALVDEPFGRRKPRNFHYQREARVSWGTRSGRDRSFAGWQIGAR